MTSETAAKKDVQKLQRAIIDGLEDVKAMDIQVFSTEHLSPLFERVIIATGQSNRQTKALAASVRDSVRDAGFAKPRIEGEENGEWIIVDCGSAVAHIMQPAIRQYYHLEEIWGDKPVRMRLGAPKPALPKASEPAPAGKNADKATAKTPAGGKTAAKRARPAAKTAGSAAPKPASKSTAKAAPKTASRPPRKTAAGATAKVAAKASTKASTKAPSGTGRAAPRKTPRA